MATAEHKGLRASEATFADDDGSHETLDDSDIEHLDDDGVPIPRATGPVPKSHQQAFSRGARESRYEDTTILPGASLPREGGLIAGKYRVDSVHARDSMVVTLKASHVDLGQRVWVRYLLPRAARRPDALVRFMRSARAVARMRSEHAARILDIGRIRSGIPFVVLDDMNGWDLDEVLRVRGPLPVQEAVEYVLQAAEAVAEAHALGIVHGSLRPANVLLARHKDESPLVKVVGFELSDVVDWTMPDDMTDTGPSPAWFTSTLPYLAPEQIRGAEYLDERVDVWALGALLFALLCGGAPFRARTAAALLAAVAADEPRLLAEVRGDVAPDLEEIVLRCLSKNPGDRPSSVSELARALTPFAPGDGLSVIDRISRMPSSSVRPPPQPIPLSRAIVPVLRSRVPVAAPRSRAPTAVWLLTTALVALGASVLGAAAVIVAANAGSRAARDDAPAAVAAESSLLPPIPTATSLSPAATPATASPEAPPQAPRAPTARPDVAAPSRAVEPAHRLLRADRSDPVNGAVRSPAIPPKDLFGDTR